MLAEPAATVGGKRRRMDALEDEVALAVDHVGLATGIASPEHIDQMLPQYADSVAYAAGDLCIYGYRIWEATDSVSGVVPVVQQGYHDSLGRLTQWVEVRFRLIDDLTGYMPALVVDAKDRSRDGFARDEATYDLQGRRLTSPLARGLYIRDGRKTVVR